jgi:hypothetical protein
LTDSLGAVIAARCVGRPLSPAICREKFVREKEVIRNGACPTMDNEANFGVSFSLTWKAGGVKSATRVGVVPLSLAHGRRRGERGLYGHVLRFLGRSRYPLGGNAGILVCFLARLGGSLLSTHGAARPLLTVALFSPLCCVCNHPFATGLRAGSFFWRADQRQKEVGTQTKPGRLPSNP